MTLEQITLLVYAILVGGGGFMGYRVAKSKPSLIAGGGSAVLLLAAFALSWSDHTLGVQVGLAVSILLALVFGLRLKKTRKLMPSGMLLVLSVVVAAILVTALTAAAP